MWSIDFLISLSLLNNQATANALVITIQHSGQGLWRQTSLHKAKDIHFCVVYHVCMEYTEGGNWGNDLIVSERWLLVLCFMAQLENMLLARG